jgi:Tfp pilus assembly protein FimT
MLEIVVVVAIMLVLAAIATPTVVNQVAAWRLHSTGMAVTGLLQQARLEAVRDNKFITVRVGAVNRANVVYIDAVGTGASDGYSGDMAYEAGEGLVQLPAAISFQQVGNPSFNTTSLLGVGGGTVTGDAALRVTFNQRGLPCRMNGSVCQNFIGGNYVSYVYFATDQNPTNGWVAVSVSPAGRIRMWTWNGAAWQ